MGTINVSLPNEMIQRIDSATEEMGYSSRSELIRGAMRNFFVDAEWVSKIKGQVLAVVTMTFNMEVRGTSEEVNRLEHKYEHLILTMIHNHAGRICLEVILAKRQPQEAKNFAEELKVIRGVETVRIAVALDYSKR